jgi:hypothetical protein
MAAWPINPFFTRVSEESPLEPGLRYCSDPDCLREAQDKLRRDRVGGNEGRPIAQSILWFGMVPDACNQPGSIPKSELPRPMAKVIEFYIPNRFQSKVAWVSRQKRGKVIEFCKR